VASGKYVPKYESKCNVGSNARKVGLKRFVKVCHLSVSDVVYLQIAPTLKDILFRSS